MNDVIDRYKGKQTDKETRNSYERKLEIERVKKKRERENMISPVIT